jgi:hypothetical protein
MVHRRAIIEVFLAFRFVFKFFNAYTGAGFTNFINSVTEPLTIPFFSASGLARLDGSVFEWTTVLVMLVYLLIGWGIVKLFLMGKTVSTPEVASKLV